MVGEVEGVTAFDAEKIAINAALITIVATNDFHASVGAANPHRGFAAISTMRAGGADMFHFPRPSFVTICAGGQSAHRANVDAHATLFAIEVVALVRRDDRTHAAVLHPERPNVHAFSADAHAAIAQNATRTVKVDDWRPLLLFAVILNVDELGFGSAVGESHVLQFTLAAGIADRTVKGMVAEEQLHHGFTCLMDLIAFGGDGHALA